MKKPMITTITAFTEEELGKRMADCKRRGMTFINKGQGKSNGRSLESDRTTYWARFEVNHRGEKNL